MRSRWTRGRVVAALVLVVLGAGIWFASSLQDGLLTYEPSRLVLDRRGAYLGEVPGAGGELGYWPVPYVLPERIVQATLVTEDRHFYEHPGVYLPSVGRALLQNARNVRVISGASTLAMQVARMQTPGGRHLWRKAREAVEALLLVREHGHEKVLRQYLAIAPYGNRVHGVVRAARLYFDKPVEDLSWAQAAFLAGLPQLPGRMNPYTEDGLRRARRRSHRILRALHAQRAFSREELEQALQADLGLVPRPQRMPEALHAVLEWSELARARSQPISTATLDLEIQSKVARILQRNLDRLDGAGAGNTAALVLDTETGDILAYVGSRDFFSEEHRGAIDFVKQRRSPGSTLKPFLYGLALEKGIVTAATELADTPMDMRTESGRSYLPENVNHTYLGPMLLREALGNSRNIPALRVLEQVGVEPALRFFEKADVGGISYEPDHYGLGLAVGNLHVTLEELTKLYLVLAHEGETRSPRRFVDEPVVPSRRLMTREAARLVRHILADPLARRPTFPVGSALDYPYAVAVKTGTSQGYRDAWAVAFSDRLLVAVWVGNHDWRRMNGLGGLLGAAGAVHEILDAVMPGWRPYRPVLDTFPPPAGALAIDVCPLSGRLAGPDCPHRKSEWFVPGTVPAESCPFHARVRLDRRNGMRAGPTCPEREVVTRVMLALPEEYEQWARRQHLDIAPLRESPLCPSRPEELEPKVAIREPKGTVRLLYDPDTPASASTLRLAADVTPSTEPIVWLVDGVPVATVTYPHEFRWSPRPGQHVITAAMVHRAQVSQPVTVVVED
ncbi:penicillin-binding protein 1C [Archangium violaceum]|uniref:penicillin-binding protein 1C n=1 Tax=Archangium violaceum TaxID=83451 RepID=UPI00194FC9BE|nr:penicillin-binding protein 1C [Archangium violaceum]QRO00237.1 penicillin-binding protein 1C [Archangium violaceum]